MASTIKSGSNNDLYIQTDGVDRIVVDSNGNTSVVGELEVNSSSSATWSNITNTAGSGNRYSGIKMQDGATINSHIYTNHQDGNFAIRNDFAGGVTRFYTTPSGGALQESMAVNGNGYVTKPYQPSFEAITNTAGTMSSGTKEFSNSTAFNGHVFTIIAHNIGSHYNSANSRFTAPVTGLYEIYGGMASHGANATTAYQSFEFYINGVRKWDGWNNKGTGYQKERTRRTFLLTAGDYVTPGYESAEVMTLLVGTTSSPYVHFGGYLIG